MDPRRFLIVVAAIPLLGGCALLGDRSAGPLPITAAEPPSAVVAASEPPDTTPVPPEAEASPPPDLGRPYLDVVRAEPAPPAAPRAHGRTDIAAADPEPRDGASGDAFIGAMRVFAWGEGRVYEVRTAPLRVTALALAPGETVTAKAAGDTVRWQIGEGVSGQGATARTHVLIKPLQAGLETNLILTTNQRVYLLSLKSGAADAFNAAVTWDYGPGHASADVGPVPHSPDTPPPMDLSVVTPQGPLDARYRIEPRGRSPRWTPTAVFNDGVRTFIALPPETGVDEAPALFVQAGGEPQLVNYRQVAGMLIVDRVFDDAELRLGDRHPRIVRIHRLPGAAR